MVTCLDVRDIFYSDLSRLMHDFKLTCFYIITTNKNLSCFTRNTSMHLSRTSLKMSRFLYPVRRINIVFFNIYIFLPVKSNVFIDTRSSKSRFLGPLKIIKYYNKKNDLNIYFNHPTGLHFLRFTFKITHLDYILYVASKIAFLGQFSAFRVFRTEVPFE